MLPGHFLSQKRDYFFLYVSHDLLTFVKKRCIMVGRTVNYFILCPMGNEFENQGRAHEVPDDTHSLRTINAAEGRRNVAAWTAHVEGSSVPEKTMGVLKTESGSKMAPQLRVELAQVSEEIAAMTESVVALKKAFEEGQIKMAENTNKELEVINEKIKGQATQEITALEVKVDLLKARQASLENDLKTL